MIELINVCKQFEGRQALDNLSLSVPDGSVFGLVGPNGAGKSTAIRHITGVLRQDSGDVLVAGEPVYENPRIKSGIFCLPDEVFYYPRCTGQDMMNLYRVLYPGFDPERYARLGQALPVDDRLQMRKLSRGMQKQVAFRIALACRPSLLVLDEPVDGLDPVMRRQVMGLVMDEVASSGMTVLISSHNLRELEDICDSVGILNKGKLLLQRTLSELQDNIYKIQIVLPEGKQLPEGLNILHTSSAGRMQTLIVRGEREQTEELLKQSEPVYMDILPLSLEEIFIYELGGADYAVRELTL